VITALQDVRSLASLATAIGLVLPLALLGMRGSAAGMPQLQPLKSLLLLMALPPLYAALCVRIDGRAIWGLYPMLVPFAAAWLAARLDARRRERGGMSSAEFELRRQTSTARALWQGLRPRHWLKNLLVFVPMLAAHAINGATALQSLLAFAAFCLCASSAYLLNDAMDAEDDRHHPVKRHRPIASGAVGLAGARRQCIAGVDGAGAVRLLRRPAAGGGSGVFRRHRRLFGLPETLADGRHGHAGAAAHFAGAGRLRGHRHRAVVLAAGVFLLPVPVAGAAQAA
jgi:hypothetical protein